MELDDPTTPEFASLRSFSRFAQRIRRSNRFVWGDDVQLFLETVVATITQRDHIIHAGTILYRAQQGVDYPTITDEDGNVVEEGPVGLSRKRMKPLQDRAKEGRANPAGIPVLYLGASIDTAISEVRPWINAEVSLARCKVLRNLRALDLSLGHASSSFGSLLREIVNGVPATPAEKKTSVWNDIDKAFSRPVTLSDDKADYAPTQVLAELFKQQGYNAITYKSQFGEEDGYNIAVFDPDVVVIKSCAPYKVRSIKIDADQCGNDWFNTSEEAQ